MNKNQCISSFVFKHVKSAVVTFKPINIVATLEDCINMKFTIKKVAQKWNTDNDMSLKLAVIEIQKNPEIAPQKNKFYWISHYQFGGRISDKCVAKRITKLLMR